MGNPAIDVREQIVYDARGYGYRTSGGYIPPGYSVSKRTGYKQNDGQSVPTKVDEYVVRNPQGQEYTYQRPGFDLKYAIQQAGGQTDSYENLPEVRAKQREKDENVRNTNIQVNNGDYGGGVQDVRAAAYRGLERPQEYGRTIAKVEDVAKPNQPQDVRYREGNTITYYESAEQARNDIAQKAKKEFQSRIEKTRESQIQSSQASIEQKETQRSNFTPNGAIREYKPSYFENARRSIEKAQEEDKTTKAILLGTGVTALKFVKGTISGYVSVFNPKTYLGLFRAIKNPKETAEAFYGIGDQIYKDPTELGEYAGQLYGVNKGSKFLSEKVLPTVKFAARRIEGQLAVEEFEFKNQGKIITSEQANRDLAKLNKDISIEVKGRPITGISAIRKTISGKSGSVSEGVMRIESAEPEVIDFNDKFDYYLIEGKSGFAAKANQNSNIRVFSKDVTRMAPALAEEKNIRFLVQRENLVKLLKEGQTEFASSEGKVKVTNSRIANGDILIIEKSVSNKGTPKVIETLEVAQAKISPIELSTEGTSGINKGAFKNRPKALRYDLILEDKSQKILPGRFIARTKYTEGTQIDLYVFNTAEILSKRFGTAINPVQSIFISKLDKPLSIAAFTSSLIKNKSPIKNKLQKEIEIIDQKGRVQILRVDTEKPKAEQRTEQILVEKYHQKEKVKAEEPSFVKKERTIAEAAYTRQNVITEMLSRQKSRAGIIVSPKQAIRLIQAQNQSQSQSAGQIKGIIQNVGQSSSQMVSVASATGIMSAQSISQSQSKSQLSSEAINRNATKRNAESVRANEAPKIFNLPDVSQKNSFLKQAFKVEVKRGGEFKTISSNLPKGKALRIGVSETKRTLGATFRITPLGATAEADTPFVPSTDEFRSYKIKQGKKIETPGTFIQERKFRLSSGSERREIQTARRLKL